MQRLAGDTAGAKITAEQARNTLEQLYRDQPHADLPYAASLSQAYAAMGKKDSALRERNVQSCLGPVLKMPVNGPSVDENLAIIQTMFGENSRAISTLTQLLQTPYMSWFYGSAYYAGPFKARSDLGPVARRSRFPKTLRGKEAVIAAEIP